MACSFCNLTEEEKHWLLAKTAHWSVYLADLQDYIGRGCIVLNRHCESLSDLSPDEWQELHGVIASYEAMLKQELFATIFNWSCLMNNAYKRADPHPHLHFHVRPRYQHPVTIGEKVFTDEEFAHHYDNNAENKLSAAEGQALFEKLKESVPHYFKAGNDQY